jgi:general stress protein 26
MSKTASDRSRSDDVTPAKKIEDLYALIEGIDIAMMTTRLPDGQLVSRPMSTQKRRPDVHLWFVAVDGSHKLGELAAEPHLNLGYFKDFQWVSVSGTATLSRDRARIRELYQPDWKAWVEDEGGDKNGGPDDPRFVLIEVRALGVTYFKRTDPRPVVMFKVLAAMVTGSPPDVGEMRHVDGSEMPTNKAR